MKIKKILLLAFCLIIIFFTTGCASIEYTRAVNNNGEILDAVSVKLDNSKITSAGYNINEVKNYIETKMQNYLLAIKNSFIERDDDLTSLEKNSVLNNIKYGVTEKDNYIIASFVFNNYSTFKYFYGLHLLTEDDDNSTKVQEFLVTKTINSGKTIFSSENAKFITNEFVSYFNNDFTINDANLIYTYGTSSNTLYSDATNKFYLDGINYHQWIIDDINQEITTYTLQANALNWYVLALALTFILLIILYLISIFKKNNKNNKNLDLNVIENSSNNSQEK